MISELDPLDRAFFLGEPLVIFEHVIPSDIDGIVITDWCCDLSFWIGGPRIRRIVVETPALAERICRRLLEEGCDPVPAIRIMEAHNVAA